MPRDSHPDGLFSAAILSMRRSRSSLSVHEGMKKTEYWDPMYEDCTNIMAKLPEIAPTSTG